MRFLNLFLKFQLYSKTTSVVIVIFEFSIQEPKFLIMIIYFSFYGLSKKIYY